MIISNIQHNCYLITGVVLISAAAPELSSALTITYIHRTGIIIGLEIDLLFTVFFIHIHIYTQGKL